MLAICLFFVWFCICYCVSWAVGCNPQPPSPNDIITFVTLPLTAYAIYYAKKAFEGQEEALEQQKILGAWSLLAQKGMGDLGRKDALEFLHSKGKSLAGLDLSNAHLVGLKLKGADLTGCNFTGANLTDAEFVECWLAGAKFVRGILRETIFKGAILSCTDFNEAQLDYVKFLRADGNKGTIPSHAYFTEAVLSSGEFIGVSFRGEVQFCRATLSHCTFKNVSLHRAVFTGARFTGDYYHRFHTFEDVDLSDAIFDNALLHHASFKATTLWKTRFVQSTILRDVCFEGCALDGIDFLTILNFDNVKFIDNFTFTHDEELTPYALKGFEFEKDENGDIKSIVRFVPYQGNMTVHPIKFVEVKTETKNP